MSELIARFLERERDAHPCIIDAQATHSYAEIVARARSVAATLSDGERVAVLAAPESGFVASLFGALLAGGRVIILSPLHPPAEQEWFCADTKVTTIFRTEPKTGASPRALPDVANDAPALQLYTSGTTGKPKGALLTHANLAVQQKLVGEAWGFSENDVLLHSLPLHHMHGLAIALFTALGAGATTRMTTFDARAIWDQMADATVFMGVPAMYHRLFVAFDAATPDERARWTKNAAALRLATSGSAAMPVTLAERWRALTGNIPLERFGMTEIGVGITNSLSGQRFPGYVGLPLPTVETRITPEGELYVRGPSVFAGYHDRPKETAAAFDDEGWFRTGDTVVRDESLPGAPFKILGRTSVDILKSGGYKLSALEIEEVLRQHPAVGEVAVVGVPDEAWGDRVVACVVTRPTASCDAATLKAFVKERLAAYKVPKDFIFMADLPKNALGKVVKPDLCKKILSET